MAEQVTIMVLKVDLKCSKCYRKVKKVLCRFPQIRDQVYDEKNDTVTIKVVCCSPERIKEKIICRGGCCIKAIEIKVPMETEGASKPPAAKPKPTTPPPTPPPPPPPPPCFICINCCVSCYNGYPGGPCFHGHGGPPPCYGRGGCSIKAIEIKVPDKPPPPKSPTATATATPPPSRELANCCGPCSNGYPGGPCFHGHGGPPPCYGRPVCDSYGGGRDYCASRCDYFSEENSAGCTIM